MITQVGGTPPPGGLAVMSAQGRLTATALKRAMRHRARLAVVVVVVFTGIALGEDSNNTLGCFNGYRDGLFSR